MSIAVLRAILGADTVDRLSENEIAALAHELDAEMRKDDVLSSRLSRVVLEAAHRIKADRDVEVAP